MPKALFDWIFRFAVTSSVHPLGKKMLFRRPKSHTGNPEASFMVSMPELGITLPNTRGGGSMKFSLNLGMIRINCTSPECDSNNVESSENSLQYLHSSDVPCQDLRRSEDQNKVGTGGGMKHLVKLVAFVSVARNTSQTS